MQLAAAHGRSELVRRLLGVNAAWAKSVDADGKSAFQLLPRGASEEAAAALFEASGVPPRPLWEMFDPATLRT